MKTFLIYQVNNFTSHQIRLIIFSFCLIEKNTCIFFFCICQRNKPFVHFFNNFKSVRIIVFDKAVCFIQNLLTRPVIFGKHHCRSFGVIFPKLNYIAYCCSPKSVNRLIIIPHHRKVGASPCQKFDQLILSIIRILKLVNQNVFKPALINF